MFTAETLSTQRLRREKAEKQQKREHPTLKPPAFILSPRALRLCGEVAGTDKTAKVFLRKAQGTFLLFN